MCNLADIHKSNVTRHFYKNHIWFIIVVLIVTATSIAAFVGSSLEFSKNIEKIAEIQHQSNEYIEEFLCHKKARHLDSDVISRILETHQERQEAILHMEYDKLNNEFDVLSIWAATITIVFLVFSLYSIFRTDDMLNKAHDSLDQISSYNKEAQQILHDARQQSDDLVRSANNRIGEIERRLANLDNRINQMGIDSTIESQSHNIEECEQDTNEENVTEEQ